jgi:hypothetical protein
MKLNTSSLHKEQTMKTKRIGKTQQEVNEGVLQRALASKPTLDVCSNHTKYYPVNRFLTVEEVRARKAKRLTGTARFKR